MLKIKRIDHVSICVRDLAAASSLWRAVFGVSSSKSERVGSQGTEVALLAFGNVDVELIAPDGNASLTRFLEKRGPGLHHIAVEVEGIELALFALKAMGVPLIDETPRVGARGHKVAFLHPKATGGVLVELVEPVVPAQP